MIDIFGGTFIMGNNNQNQMSNDQDPEHSVYVSDFKIGETEVSNAYYVSFLNEMIFFDNFCLFKLIFKMFKMINSLVFLRVSEKLKYCLKI